MSAWAIKNTNSGKYLYGTDYRYDPPHQRTAKEIARMYHTEESALNDLVRRRCGTNYHVVEVELKEVGE